MEDLGTSTSMAPAPDSSVATIPPAAEAPARWGVGGDGQITETPAASPARDSALSLDKLGATANRSFALDRDGDISDEFMANLSAQMKGTREKTERAVTAPAEFKEFGLSHDEIKETLQLATNLYSAPSGVVDALRGVFERAPDIYAKVVATVVGSDPGFAIQQLVSLGALPEFSTEPKYHLPSDLAQLIPQELWPTARTISTQVLLDFAQTGVDGLVHMLDQEKQKLEVWRENERHGAQQWAQALQQAQYEGRAQLQQSHDYWMGKHNENLAKWKPFDDEQTNDQVRRMAFTGALDTLLADEKWQAIWQRFNVLLDNAPSWRLCGESMKADSDEREARSLIERFNVKLKQVMLDQVKRLDAALKSKAVKEAEEEKAQEREPGERPPMIGPDGNITEEWNIWFNKYGKAANAAKGGK